MNTRDDRLNPVSDVVNTLENGEPTDGKLISFNSHHGPIPVVESVQSDRYVKCLLQDRVAQHDRRGTAGNNGATSSTRWVTMITLTKADPDASGEIVIDEVELWVQPK